MKVAPERPHFFKPIVPGFKNGLKIPIGFLKYLKGHDLAEHAILRRGGKNWKVKVNGRRLEDGWEKFAEEHDLQLRDVLVFKYEGNLVFEVTIFDPSHCQREYERPQQGVDQRETGKEKTDSVSRTSGKAFPNNVEASYKDMYNPHFTCIIRPYCLSKHFLSIPNQFARESRLKNRKCKLLVRDKRRSWTFNLYTCSSNTYFGSGWREFCIDNCLKEGDSLMFELVSNGETPTLRFHDLRGNPSIQAKVKRKNLDCNRIPDKEGLHFQEQKSHRTKTSDATAPKSQEPALTFADDHTNPRFISTIKPYTISNPVLYLPLPFVKSNGLMNRRCEMILIDENRRSWSVQIGPMPPHFGIKGGLRGLIKANNVQVGDTYKFELINNGTTPIAYFHCKYSGKDAKNHISNSQDNEAVDDGQGKDSKEH